MRVLLFRRGDAQEADVAQLAKQIDVELLQTIVL